MRNYADLFNGLGTFETEYEILIKDNAQPIAHAPRKVPHVLKDKLKMKLNELERNEIIEKADEYSEWVNHLVTVYKRDVDKSLRICIDPCELNEYILEEQVYIPTFEEFSSNMVGMKYYSVLDLKDGFWHVKLSEKSRKLCTFATPFGNYRYKRMPFGIKTGPKIFQKMNMMNFGNIKNVYIYFDDILIVGRTKQEHDEALIAVLERARQKNVRFNENKMQIACESVKYLGHIFSFNEIKPDPERLEAINKMERPKNKKDLQTLLGVLNFMRSFIPNLSEKTAPLRELLKKYALFNWTELHTQVLSELKNEILKSNILMPFDTSKEIAIQCDASQNGLGCCILQDGKPISFASRSLTDAEQNYSQIEKEMLSIIFACTKFNFYTYGRTIKIINDHKPLLGIIKKDIHKIASAKLQRMRLKLLNYDLRLEYAPGKTIQLADYLSRYMLPCTETDEDKIVSESILIINVSDERKIEIQNETENDIELRKIKNYCKQGWPTHKTNCDSQLNYYFKLKSEIFLEDNLLFFNDRLIIPKIMRKSILNKLHEPHFGLTKTLIRARNSVFWSNINNEIEQTIMKCITCQQNAQKNRKEPMIAHDIPNYPFNKIACDVLEFKSKDYLVVVDFYSKWIELINLKRKTAKEINIELLKLFARYGYPQVIIADNMPFGSFECKEFAKANDIQIITSSPNYPQSNGMAERAVQICKQILRKNETEEAIYKALMAYRSTATKDMKNSPAELLQGRILRTDLPVRKNKFTPNIEIEEQLKHKQEQCKKYFDKSAKERTPFNINDKILFINNNKWQNGIIVEICKEPRSYKIQSDGRVYRRNSKHIRMYHENKITNESDCLVGARSLMSERYQCHQKMTRSGRSY